MNFDSSLAILFLILLISLAETVSQTCFKSAVERVDMPTRNFREMLALSLRLLFVFRIWAGMWLGLATLGIWAIVLNHAELNFAFSLSSAHYIFIALSSKFILKEAVNGKRWLGTILIAIGITIVSYTHG